MPYSTDKRLKNYLDTNQLHREQMCLAVLSLDKRFSNIRPRQPRGGPDGGRDIEAIFKDDQIAYCAVGFINQAIDSLEQKNKITSKFEIDLSNAIKNKNDLSVFIFFTNINFTVKEKEVLIEKSKMQNIIYCDVFDRERLRISLDSPDGFSIRFQYLNIPLSEEEQASFFARWGDDIQAVISTGFNRIENTLNRLLFLQEAKAPILYLNLSIELDDTYLAEDIGHFRFFCFLTLKEPKSKILSLLFGNSDKAKRTSKDISEEDILTQKAGIKYGICGGQWEQYIELENDKFIDNDKYVCRCTFSSVGIEKTKYLNISYSTDTFIRIPPYISLIDLDDAMYIISLNKSLAQKVKAIFVYSNSYKLAEYQLSDFYIDDSEYENTIPIKFCENELEDPWVRIRPKTSSSFIIRFYEETPKRMFLSS